MSARMPRVLKHSEKKLMAVPKAAARKLAAKYSWASNARIYYNMQGKMFAAYTRQPNPQNNFWTSVVSNTGHKNWGSAFLSMAPMGKMAARATADFSIGERKMLEITDLSKNKMLWRMQTGELLFRVILNEAIRIAKKEKVNIGIEADNEKLKGYYETFGFEFNNPKKPMEGTLTIFKTNGSAKK